MRAWTELTKSTSRPSVCIGKTALLLPTYPWTCARRASTHWRTAPTRPHAPAPARVAHPDAPPPRRTPHPPPRGTQTGEPAGWAVSVPPGAARTGWDTPCATGSKARVAPARPSGSAAGPSSASLLAAVLRRLCPETAGDPASITAEVTARYFFLFPWHKLGGARRGFETTNQNRIRHLCPWTPRAPYAHACNAGWNISTMRTFFSATKRRSTLR